MLMLLQRRKAKANAPMQTKAPTRVTVFCTVKHTAAITTRNAADGHNLSVRLGGGAVGLHVDAQGLCHANGVGQLHQHALNFFFVNFTALAAAAAAAASGARPAATATGSPSKNV